jgi:hypothetical protein
MSSQGIMSSKKANNNPGLCPIKGQKSGLWPGLGPEILQPASEYYKNLIYVV